MPRKRKQKIEVNNVDSLEGLLQEVYNDACAQINDANRISNELKNSTEPDGVDDATKIAKEKITAAKLKEGGMKVKLEVAKIQSDLIKHGGNVQKTMEGRYDGADITDFEAIRKAVLGVKDDNEIKD